MNPRHPNGSGPRTFATHLKWIVAILSFLTLAFSEARCVAAPIAGHVEAWGDNTFGKSTPPAGLDGVIAVAAGADHSMALLSNGTVVAWGANFEGETVIPQGLNNVVAIAAASHCVALKNDGSVVVWGNTLAEVTNVPSGLNAVAAIAAGMLTGNAYTLALRSNGTVVAWGLMPPVTNLPPNLNDVVQVAAGLSHALALKNDGTVVGWGDNFGGAATPPPDLSGVVAVRASQFCSLALKSDGTMVPWGDFPPVPSDLGALADVQIGGNHVIALRSNGVAVAWGQDFFGEGSVPWDLSGVTAISAGSSHNLVITRRPVIQSISPPVIATAGQTVTFSVNASGAPLMYQWQRNTADVPDATGPSLTLTNVQAGDAGIYRVVVGNPFGSTISPQTSLSFPPPQITAQPSSATAYRGETVSFNVVAQGLGPLAYQWRKDGVSLSGATTAMLTLINVRSTNAGGYQAFITDAARSTATSIVATLTIIDPRLTNSVLGPVTDTTIYSSGANPQGTGTILAGTRQNGIIDRGLIRFDLSSIPAGAVVQSANLRLTVVKAPRSGANSTFSIHRVLKPWGVDATWADATTGTPWSAPGGLSGDDYVPSSSASCFVMSYGTYEFSSNANMVADIQAWVSSPATNQGWMLKTESEDALGSARHFRSSEGLPPPQLLLEYATPAHLSDVQVQAGKLSFRFEGAAGWLYRVDCRENVEAGAWTTVTNVPAGPAGSVLISIPVIGQKRFYRVVAE